MCIVPGSTATGMPGVSEHPSVTVRAGVWGAAGADLFHAGKTPILLQPPECWMEVLLATAARWRQSPFIRLSFGSRWAMDLVPCGTHSCANGSATLAMGEAPSGSTSSQAWAGTRILRFCLVLMSTEELQGPRGSSGSLIEADLTTFRSAVKCNSTREHQTPPGSSSRPWAGMTALWSPPGLVLLKGASGTSWQEHTACRCLRPPTAYITCAHHCCTNCAHKHTLALTVALLGCCPKT